MDAGSGSRPGGAALAPHPAGGAGPVAGVTAALRRSPDGALVIRYVLKADLSRLRVPASAAPRRADGLWRHTCFEAFVRRAGAEGYHEFNFSPSGTWAAYAFRRYREGGPDLEGDFDPQIKVHRQTDRLELNATIPFSFLPPVASDVRLRIGLSAVIEDLDDALSYWALFHPPGKPDFHHPDAFALELDLEEDGK